MRILFYNRPLARTKKEVRQLGEARKTPLMTNEEIKQLQASQLKRLCGVTPETLMTWSPLPNKLDHRPDNQQDHRS
ncbi:MAG: hypothetical protein BRC50_10040 [Cyanobacteria bacterium SW_11_48_12]|nr:MAG: hypothetical protein BRC50_10040 [Cyanobacteria bacterium SW_11_48_12]